MDVKKMVSFCKSTLFFIRGKREVDMSPLSSNAFCINKTKNDIHAAWEYYNAQSPSSSSSSASNKKTSFLSFVMRPFCWTSSRSRWDFVDVDSIIADCAFFFLPFVAILFWRWWFGRDEVTSATTTFEASESAARRVPLPTRDTDDDFCCGKSGSAHNEDDEGCTPRLVARGGILVQKWCVPFLWRKNRNFREKKSKRTRKPSSDFASKRLRVKRRLEVRCV